MLRVKYKKMIEKAQTFFPKGQAQGYINKKPNNSRMYSCHGGKRHGDKYKPNCEANLSLHISL